jgi:SOS response regulatory protein OraA/RecX
LPVVSALRASGRGRVRVELDGEAWRVLPLEPVVRAGLAEGVELDRARARTLAQELRRALARRDLSERGVRDRLKRAGVASTGAEEAVGTLRRAGLLDDGRFAADRALGLADRGLGNAAIRFDLERHGIAASEIEAALAVLEPERERAERIVSRRGPGPATARHLARRGFAEDAVEAAAAASVAPDE